MFLVKKGGYSGLELLKAAELFRGAHRELSKYCFGTDCTVCEHRRLCRDLKTTANWLQDQYEKEMDEQEVTSRGMRVQKMP